jgi:hypothetical protein
MEITMELFDLFAAIGLFGLIACIVEHFVVKSEG